ncbi:hypothetical protein [Tsukamurella hominis]|uniref:hypothetical protein n=1 Tax=Tsukamurella hominis TaxID=1970232 RepID=UPI0039EB346F
MNTHQPYDATHAIRQLDQLIARTAPADVVRARKPVMPPELGTPEAVRRRLLEHAELVATRSETDEDRTWDEQERARILAMTDQELWEPYEQEWGPAAYPAGSPQWAAHLAELDHQQWRQSRVITQYPSDFGKDFAASRQSFKPLVPKPTPPRQNLELVQVDRTDLDSGERTRICWKGNDPVFHGSDYLVIEPAHNWRLGWFLDKPDPDRGNVAAVVRADLDHREYAVSEFAVPGLLAMSAYALGGRYGTVPSDEAAAAVADVLMQLDTYPCNIDGVGHISVPLGFSLQVLDANRLDFWRRQPRAAGPASIIRTQPGERS